jgi:hypothetical protein
MLRCSGPRTKTGCYFVFQVIEIPRGSKVKYELDKKTGLIMVNHHCSFLSLMLNLSSPMFLWFSLVMCVCAGGPCALFISCVPS